MNAIVNDCSKFFIFNQKISVFERARFFSSKLRDRNQNTLRKREFFVSTRYDRNNCDFFQKIQFRNDKKKRLWCEKWISKWIIIFQISLFVFISFTCLLFCINNWNEFQYMKHVDRFHWFEFDKILISQSIYLFIQTSSRNQQNDKSRFFRLFFIFCFLSIQSFVSSISQINLFVKSRYRNDEQIQKQMLSFRIVICLNEFESINFFKLISKICNSTISAIAWKSTTTFIVIRMIICRFIHAINIE